MNPDELIKWLTLGLSVFSTGYIGWKIFKRDSQIKQIEYFERKAADLERSYAELERKFGEIVQKNLRYEMAIQFLRHDARVHPSVISIIDGILDSRINYREALEQLQPDHPERRWSDKTQ